MARGAFSDFVIGSGGLSITCDEVAGTRRYLVKNIVKLSPVCDDAIDTLVEVKMAAKSLQTEQTKQAEHNAEVEDVAMAKAKDVDMAEAKDKGNAKDDVMAKADEQPSSSSSEAVQFLCTSCVQFLCTSCVHLVYISCAILVYILCTSCIPPSGCANGKAGA